MLASGQAAPAQTKAGLLRIAASGYDACLNKTFDGMEQLEHLDLTVKRTFTIAGSPLEPAAAALTQAGIDVGTTFGSLMDATGITEDDIHDVSCKCHSETATGAQLKARLRAVADAS